MMKKYLKKGLAGFLTLIMALSALTCLAAADESSAPEITIYITCDQEEIRPGHDAYIDAKYTIGPVEELSSFRCEVPDIDGLEFALIMREGSDLGVLGDIMFGNGNVSASNHIINGAGEGATYTGTEDLYMFSARYTIPSSMEEDEVTFGLESFSFMTRSGAAVVNIVTEPVRVVMVDTSTLEKKVASAENYLSDPDRFSRRSVQALEDALDKANEILEHIENYYQADVDEALDVLNAAIDNLKSPAQEVDAAIEAAENLRQSDYTEESWGNMTDALEAAKQLRNDKNASDEDLNAAADALYDAIDALEMLPEEDALAASREALEKAIETVKDLNQDDYSESAWAALQAALENAEKVLSDENATKEELDEAYDALALALARANLEKDVDYAKQLSSSNYTADSWEALQTAITNAEEILNDENATQAELEDADDALIAALNGLVTTGDGGGTTTTYPGGTSNGGTTTTSGVLSPQTGDSSILLMCMIVLAVGMASCAAVCISKACGRRE